MLRLPEVLKATGLSRTSIWELEQAGTFPRRRRLTARAVAWRSDEIEAWMRSRPEIAAQAAAR
jgi:prophage regulatory protein